MKINLQSPVEEIQIQIIPLIDVVFCVLTFFILAALQFTRQQAISVDLPKASTSTIPQVRQTLIVTIDAVGQVYVEKQPVRIEQLHQVLQAYHQSNPSGMLILNASRTATYNDVVQVLDMLRAVGGDRVSLATVPTSAAPSTGDRSINPNAPSVPGSIPAPSTAPSDPYGIPNSANPYDTSNPYNSANPYGTSNPYNQYPPNQYPTPGQIPGGQGVNPVNPGISPVNPIVPPATTPSRQNPSPK